MKSFPFTEAKVKALDPPSAGRVYRKDSRFPGLQVCVTAAGAKTYYFVKRIGGRPTRVRLGTVDQLSVESARTAAGAVTGDLAAGRDPQQDRRAKQRQPSLQELFAHWMLYAVAHKKPSSAAGDEWLYKRYLGTWGQRRLGTIKKTDVQGHHAKIGRESGPYAANRMLSLLAAMFAKADALGYVGPNPCKGVEKFREQSRDRFLQGDELPRFFQALQEEVDPFPDIFALCLATGARKGNVLGMRWADLNLDAGLWRIPGEVAKAGEVMVIPLLPQAVEILDRRQQTANGSEWVFPSRSKVGHVVEVKSAWKRILRRAGLTDLRIHDLRRTLGSYMAMQGASLLIVGKALGHRTQSASAIYARLQVDPVRAAMTAGAQRMLAAANGKGTDDGRTQETK